MGCILHKEKVVEQWLYSESSDVLRWKLCSLSSRLLPEVVKVQHTKERVVKRGWQSASVQESSNPVCLCIAKHLNH